MRHTLKTILAAAGITALTATAGVFTPAEDAKAAGASAEYKQVNWSWSGLFGHYDQAQLQRGFQIYSEVCGNCHSLRLVAYRNLTEIGFSEDQVKDIASSFEVEDGPDEFGDMFFREAIPADRFVPPFPNEQAAASANGGALPPDLSLMAKARMDGPNYLYSLMTGYDQDLSTGEVPEEYATDSHGEEVTIPEDKYFNPYFPGYAISMPPQLWEEGVEYEDGTEATISQQAQDIAAFLNWAAEPELNERKSMGIKVLIFLTVFTAMLLALKLSIWRDVKGH
ncbi:MAG: cytochrome c1 [Rhodospirillaceae bacterium]